MSTVLPPMSHNRSRTGAGSGRIRSGGNAGSPPLPDTGPTKRRPSGSKGSVTTWPMDSLGVSPTSPRETDSASPTKAIMDVYQPGLIFRPGRQPQRPVGDTLEDTDMAEEDDDRDDREGGRDGRGGGRDDREGGRNDRDDDRDDREGGRNDRHDMRNDRDDGRDGDASTLVQQRRNNGRQKQANSSARRPSKQSGHGGDTVEISTAPTVAHVTDNPFWNYVQQNAEQLARGNAVVFDGASDAVDPMDSIHVKIGELCLDSSTSSQATRQSTVDVVNTEIRPDEKIDMLLTRLEGWYARWCKTPGSKTDEVDAYMYARELFGARGKEMLLGDSNNMNTRIKEELDRIHMRFRKLRDGLTRTGALVNNKPGVLNASDKMCRIEKAIYIVYNMLVQNARFRLMSSAAGEQALPNKALEEVRPANMEDAQLNGVQEIILMLLGKARRESLRKVGSLIYRQRINKEGYGTHSWFTKGENGEEILAWIHASIPKETEFAQWCNLTEKGDRNAVTIARFLEMAYDSDFPFLKKSREFFSFRNGVYHIEKDRFFAHHELSDDVVACNYFDLDFHNEEYEKVYDPENIPAGHKAGDCWFNIPTPHFEGILTYQGFPESVRRWIYIFLGRCLYDVGQHDGWQIQLFLKGFAGTGKSTILNLMRTLYDPKEVGTMNNRVEANFALEALYQCYICLAMDIKSDFRLDQALWQSMVSGESLGVARKHKPQLSLIWRVPCLFAGNTAPGWMDNSGSVARRLAVVEFSTQVSGGDSKLLQKLEMERPALLKKINCAYRFTTEDPQFEGADIWSLLPPYFHDTKSKLTAQTNPLELFLNSVKVQAGEGEVCLFSDFNLSFQRFCAEGSLPRMALTQDNYLQLFKKHKMSVVREARDMPDGKVLSGDWIHNLALVD